MIDLETTARKMGPEWFAGYRRAWIAETLRVFGFINRQHLIRKFGISVPVASKDLNAFMRMHPGVMEYDKSAKQYIPHKNPRRKT